MQQPGRNERPELRRGRRIEQRTLDRRHAVGGGHAVGWSQLFLVDSFGRPGSTDPGRFRVPCDARPGRSVQCRCKPMGANRMRPQGPSMDAAPRLQRRREEYLQRRGDRDQVGRITIRAGRQAMRCRARRRLRRRRICLSVTDLGPVVLPAASDHRSGSRTMPSGLSDGCNVEGLRRCRSVEIRVG